MMEGTPGTHLVQPPAQRKAFALSSVRLLRALPRQVLRIAKDGDSTASLSSLFQCLTTLTVRILNLYFLFR